MLFTKPIRIRPPELKLRASDRDMTENIVAAIKALDVEPQTKKTNYPEPFASRVAGREKRRLGDVFGLTNFGVNLTRLAPGAISALRHSHGVQDEFIYILEGQPTLVTNAGETPLRAGMCAGFKAGTGDAHHLLNKTDTVVVYIEVGDRIAGDSVVYPDDDLAADYLDGGWVFRHKSGDPY